MTGREGPGAGRPAKLYRRSDRILDVSVPPRRYELAAKILLEAVRARDVDGVTLGEVATRTGHEVGARGLGVALVETGYEPAEENGETRFRNCPFHVLRDQARKTTCGLNLALVERMIEGAGSHLSAVLAPEDGYCCVRLQPASVIETDSERKEGLVSDLSRFPGPADNRPSPRVLGHGLNEALVEGEFR